MSIFSNIVAAEHTFAAWAEKELRKLTGELPSLIDVVDTTLAYAGPILQTVVVAATKGDAAAGAKVKSVIAEVMADLTVVRGVITDAGPVASAKSMLQSISDNLENMLTAAHITDDTSVGLVTKVVKEIVALIAAFPA